jgi:hypothetical protein
MKQQVILFFSVFESLRSMNKQIIFAIEIRAFYLYNILFCEINKKPVSTAERSKASTVYDRLNIDIGGSNPARGMDVCVCFSVLYCPV